MEISRISEINVFSRDFCNERSLIIIASKLYFEW
jgi:hypothetical protein